MMKTAKFWGIVISVAFVLVGIFLPCPSKDIDIYDYEYYVGGDAYNIQIEASLRGGMIGGFIVSKTLLISIGVLMGYCVLSKQGLKTEEQIQYQQPNNTNNTNNTKKTKIEKSVPREKTPENSSNSRSDSFRL